MYTRTRRRRCGTARAIVHTRVDRDSRRNLLLQSTVLGVPSRKSRVTGSTKNKSNLLAGAFCL